MNKVVKIEDKAVTTTAGERCFKSHPPLPLGNGMVIYGGNCGTPHHKDCDVYVSLDRASFDTPTYPWQNADKVSFLFRIVDQHAPDDKAEFRRMIEWLALQLLAGKKVHVGCIGGHGRTGTVFAALVAHMKVDPDPIAYVRKQYCTKAVESQAQVDYLVKEWGCKSAKPRHTQGWGQTTSYTGTSKSWGKSSTGQYKADYGNVWDKKEDKVKDSGEPQRTAFSVWSSAVAYIHGRKP